MSNLAKEVIILSAALVVTVSGIMWVFWDAGWRP